MVDIPVVSPLFLLICWAMKLRTIVRTDLDVDPALQKDYHPSTNGKTGALGFESEHPLSNNPFEKGDPKYPNHQLRKKA